MEIIGTQAFLIAIQQWDKQTGAGESGSELPISVGVQAQIGVAIAEIPALVDLWASRNQIGHRQAEMGSSRLLVTKTKCRMKNPSSAASSSSHQSTLLFQTLERRAELPATLKEQLSQHPLEERHLQCWSSLGFPSSLFWLRTQDPLSHQKGQAGHLH